MSAPPGFLLLLALFLAASPPVAAGSAPSPCAPLSSPLYDAVGALWAAGLAPAPHLGARPVGEDALRGLLERAFQAAPERALTALRCAGLGPWDLLLPPGGPSRDPGRLPEESPWPAGVRDPRAGQARRPDLRRVGPWSVRLRAADVETGRGLESFDSGGYLDDGASGVVEVGWSELSLGGRADARFRARASRIDAAGRVVTAAMRWRWGGADLTVGREPLWLGPGREGALILSNEAPPYDHVRIQTAGPGPLPGLLRRLGPASFHASLGRLSGRRTDYDNPLLLGMRASLAPVPWLELGATRTVLFGGDGRADRLTAGDLLKILFAVENNRVGSNDPADNDQLAAVDASLALPLLARVPGLMGGRFTLEYAGEDRIGRGLLPTAVGRTIGADLLTRVGSVRAEVAEATDDGAYWYGHRIYTEGYRYRGRLLGHAMGGDSRWGVLEAVVPLGGRLSVWGRYEERRHGYNFIAPRPGFTEAPRAEIRREAGLRMGCGPAAVLTFRYAWRTTGGKLVGDEARAERQRAELSLEYLP